MHKAARDLDPLSPVINTAIAVAHEKLGEFDEALDQYEELLQIFPEYAAVKNRLAGLQWSKLARLDTAIRLQLDAVEIDPTYSRSPTELALLLMDLGLATPAKQWVDTACASVDAWPGHSRCSANCMSITLTMPQ